MNKLLPFLAWLTCFLMSYASHGMQEVEGDYWQITNRNSIVWDLQKESRLPHSGNIEMSGKNVSGLIYYQLDDQRNLTLSRDIIFPQLRTFNKTNEPDWKKFRAYFRRTTSDETGPALSSQGKTLIPGAIDSLEIAGKLIIYHQVVNGIAVTRTLFPSMDDRLLVEKWQLTNFDSETQTIHIGNVDFKQREKGYKGDYTFVAFSQGNEEVQLKPGETYTFPLYFGAKLNEEQVADFDWKRAEKGRDEFLRTMKQQLVLRTPDEVVNTLFYFSKIRAAESIFNSRMGLVHSPGGGNYYVGIWANDQIEYSGPFFPYLGYETGNVAAYNAYDWFLKNRPADFSNIPYAFEVDGNFPMKHLDRGDAAMISYGTSRFLLTLGDQQKAEKLWPLIEWSLAYCHQKRNEAGAITSQSDEMEGRIATGTANLSTSSLYYGGLGFASRLAEALGKKQLAKTYKRRRKEMERVIEAYFGHRIEGLDTYRYFDGNKYLRHWICLPLTMGIQKRQAATLEALFNKLWTENGVLVELNESSGERPVFWDRATLYAFRGALKAGATDLAWNRFESFSRKRLLGDHVPYVIEAYPENNKKHLSAESALYCSVITEGLFGIEPIGLNQVKVSPTLPDSWQEMELSNIALQGQSTQLTVTRKEDQLWLTATVNDQLIYDAKMKEEGVTLRIH